MIIELIYVIIYIHTVPPDVSPSNLVILSFNTTSTLAVIQWNPVYYSNGPVTGYRLFYNEANGISVQGPTNTMLEVNVTSDVELFVKVAAVNSAGEGIPTAQAFSLNGKTVNYHMSTWLLRLLL